MMAGLDMTRPRMPNDAPKTFMTARDFACPNVLEGEIRRWGGRPTSLNSPKKIVVVKSGKSG